MDNQFQTLDHESLSSRVSVRLVEPRRFLILSFLSFGLYELYWCYKAWRFFKEKEELDILPVPRAIFGIFFLQSLFTRILN